LIGRAAQPVAGVITQVNGRSQAQGYGKQQDEEQPAGTIARCMGAYLIHVTLVGLGDDLSSAKPSVGLLEGSLWSFLL
jgi:hypothetical protein